MDIVVESTCEKVVVVGENCDVEVISENNEIIISDIGGQGPPGPAQGLPAGGVARQSLQKIDSADYNTQWKSNWYDYATNVEYTGVETPVSSGDVLECTIDSNTIYRFINSTNNANGYPIEDSFYSNFDGSTLTNLIVTRG